MFEIFLNNSVRLLLYYFMWIMLHYIGTHMYVNYCAPLSITGFILSPYVISLPSCVAFRWLIQEGNNSIIAMWFAIGTFMINMLLRK